MKKSHCSDQIRSNASSESQSDASDSSIQKLASEGKCNGGGGGVPTVARAVATAPGCSKPTNGAGSGLVREAAVSSATTSGSASEQVAAQPATAGAVATAGAPAKKEGAFDGDKDPSRRPSKDESSSSSSDSPSGDEYNVYYYDPKAAVNNATGKDPKVEAHGSGSANVGTILRT
jgi:hypothetical protein